MSAWVPATLNSKDNMTLHIIGNGFDIHHGIASTYGAFKDYAWKHTKDGYHLGMLETCYPEIDPKTGELVLWSELEQALGQLDFDAAFNICTEDIEIEEDHEIRYQAEMEDAPSTFLPLMYDAFHSIFNQWVNSIDIDKTPDKHIEHFDRHGLFLQFNYTETLELLYRIPRHQINYIHGRRKSDDVLIVGHCNDVDSNAHLSSDPMIYEYQAYEDIARIVNEEQKQVSDILLRNQCYFKSLTKVDKIVIYGHSLSEVDRPYFKEISENVQTDAKWYFSLYYQNPEERRENIGKVLSMIDYLELDHNYCHTFSF